VANALAAGSDVRLTSYRDYSTLTANQVDDTPFGGGAGMVLRVDVVDAALQGFYGRDSQAVRGERRVVALTPSGRVLDDALAAELAVEPALTLLSGRYEGFDERVVDHLATDAVSIGRYVLAGGELPAMVVMDAILRKLPGALGHEASAVEDMLQRPLKALSVAVSGVRTEGPMAEDIPLEGQRRAEFVFSDHVQRKLADIRAAKARPESAAAAE